MKHYFSLLALVGLMCLAGCSNATESTPLPGIQGTLEVVTEITQDAKTVEVSDPMPYLSADQLEEYKAEKRNSILTTFKACNSEDSEALVNTEFFDARVQMCRAADYTDDFYIETFENEVVYCSLKDNHREIWHKISIDTTYIPVETYMSFIEDYLSEYKASLIAESDYKYTKNVFMTNNLYIMLTQTNDSIWIGMTDCEKITSEVLKTFKE